MGVPEGQRRSRPERWGERLVQGAELTRATLLHVLMTPPRPR
ncbi:hypothetical protein ACFYXM_31235 [Streptomyces sp. NPDC002476]